MPIVLFNVLVASIAVCSVDNVVAPRGQQAAFASEQTPGECRLILTSHFQFEICSSRPLLQPFWLLRLSARHRHKPSTTAHTGKLTPAQYKDLAARIETEVGGIVANCKLEPKADAMPHLLIADLGNGVSTMIDKNPEQRPALGLVKVAQTLDQYGSYFEHPGFKPIGNVH